MDFTKCGSCNHKDVCKFIIPITNLQVYVNDWSNTAGADDIVSVDINCQCYKENKNKLHIDKNVESSSVKFYSGTSPVAGTESDSSKNVIY